MHTFLIPINARLINTLTHFLASCERIISEKKMQKREIERERERGKILGQQNNGERDSPVFKKRVFVVTTAL